MLNWLSQIAQLTLFNVRTIPRRKGAAISAVVGIAGVVAVVVAVLSIGQGIRNTTSRVGSDDIAMIMRSGADSEMVSSVSRDAAQIIANAPGVARGEKGALISPELFVILQLPKRTTGTDANVPLRGIEPAAFEVRGDIDIVEGRMFGWGRNEVIVGRGASSAFSGLTVGDTVPVGREQWNVTGIFEADGGLPESEVWADAAVVQSAFRRGSGYQVAMVRLSSAGSFQQFKDALTTDPQLNVQVQRMPEYYASQSQLLQRIVSVLGTLVAALMGLGALFAALNTMYTVVAARSREIATLKALGFHSSPVIISILIESLLLAATGGIAGALLAWAAFDGYRTATMNWQSFSQVTFAFDVNGPLVVQGILYALAIGLVGGLLPAIRAVRLPVATALREG